MAREKQQQQQQTIESVKSRAITLASSKLPTAASTRTAKPPAKVQRKHHLPTPESPDLNDEEPAAAVDAPKKTRRANTVATTSRLPVRVDKGKRKETALGSHNQTSEVFIAPSQSTSATRIKPSRKLAKKEPVASTSQLDVFSTSTPHVRRSVTPHLQSLRSSSVARGREASIALDSIYSAVKPIPLKNIQYSSPPHAVIKYSESEDESNSDTEFRLKSLDAESGRKRRTIVGEFEWDERSRSCVPKRERSRSRSVFNDHRRHQDDMSLDIHTDPHVPETDLTQATSRILNGLEASDNAPFPEYQSMHDANQDFDGNDMFDLPQELTHNDHQTDDAVEIFDFTNAIGPANDDSSESEREDGGAVEERGILVSPVDAVNSSGRRKVETMQSSSSAPPSPFLSTKTSLSAGLATIHPEQDALPTSALSSPTTTHISPQRSLTSVKRVLASTPQIKAYSAILQRLQTTLSPIRRDRSPSLTDRLPGPSEQRVERPEVHLVGNAERIQRSPTSPPATQADVPQEHLVTGAVAPVPDLNIIDSSTVDIQIAQSDSHPTAPMSVERPRSLTPASIARAWPGKPLTPIQRNRWSTPQPQSVHSIDIEDDVDADALSVSIVPVHFSSNAKRLRSPTPGLGANWVPRSPTLSPAPGIASAGSLIRERMASPAFTSLKRHLAPHEPLSHPSMNPPTHGDALLPALHIRNTAFEPIANGNEPHHQRSSAEAVGRTPTAQFSQLGQSIHTATPSRQPFLSPATASVQPSPFLPVDHSPLLERIRQYRRTISPVSPRYWADRVKQETPEPSHAEQTPLPVVASTPKNTELSLLGMPAIEDTPESSAAISAATSAGAVRHAGDTVSPVQRQAISDATTIAATAAIKQKAQPAATRNVSSALNEATLSPNVTIRRSRSRSRSTNSTMSLRSKPNTPGRPSTARRLSFAELGSFDSSPLSVAASVGRDSFKALSYNSDESSSDESADAVRVTALKSPSTRIRRSSQILFDSPTGPADRFKPAAISPSRLTSAADLRHSGPMMVPTSTPARLMSGMALASSSSPLAPAEPMRLLTSTSARNTATRERENDSSSLSSPSSDEHAIFAHPPALDTQAVRDDELSMAVEVSSDAIGTEGNATAASIATSLAVHMDEFFEADIAPDGDDADSAAANASCDTSASRLDEARPRSLLKAPTIASRALPNRIRKYKRFSNTHSSAAQVGGRSDPASAAGSHLQKAGRERSASRSSSVSASAMVQVSSSDAGAAARAALILHTQHKYVRGSSHPIDEPHIAQDPNAADRLLDELLREAEHDVTAQSGARLVTKTDSSVRFPRIERERTLSPEKTMVRRVDRTDLSVRVTGAWTRREWRSLEQCFIDEHRRLGNKEHLVEIAEVIRLFLENEGVRVNNCVGDWSIEKLEVRVEALIQRKAAKALANADRRERSTSVATSTRSQAPSEFFANEDARIDGTLSQNRRYTSILAPSRLAVPLRLQVRHGWSAEPPSLVNRLQRRYSPLPLNQPAHKRAGSVTSVASEPSLRPGIRAMATNQMYPSLDDLRLEMRPPRSLAIRGRLVAARVNSFEQIEEEQMIEAHRSQILGKRKGSFESENSDRPDQYKRPRL